MNPLLLTVALAIIGTALAFAAGVVGGLIGGVLLVAASAIITMSGFIIGSESYYKGYTDAQEEDIYE